MNKQNIDIAYDDLTDVLYLTSGNIVYTKNSEDEAGLVLRYDLSTKEPVGATIIDFKEYWIPQSQRLIEKLASFFHISINDARKVIRSIH